MSTQSMEYQARAIIKVLSSHYHIPVPVVRFNHRWNDLCGRYDNFVHWNFPVITFSVKTYSVATVLHEFSHYLQWHGIIYDGSPMHDDRFYETMLRVREAFYGGLEARAEQISEQEENRQPWLF